MCQPLRLLRQAVGIKVFDSPGNPGVNEAAAILEHRTVSDLMGQGMLERVFEIGKHTRLVEEFTGPQVGEPLSQPLLTQFGDRQQ